MVYIKIPKFIGNINFTQIWGNFQMKRENIFHNCKVLFYIKKPKRAKKGDIDEEIYLERDPLRNESDLFLLEDVRRSVTLYLK